MKKYHEQGQGFPGSGKATLDHDEGTKDMKKTTEEMIAQVDAELREQGASYTALSLIECRSDQLADEIRWAEESNSEWCCLKPPSGYEVSVPLELVKQEHAKLRRSSLRRRY